MKSLSAFCIGILLATCTCGCWSSMAEEGLATAAARDGLYFRTTNFFAETILFKPAEADPAGPFSTFAPLVLQEQGAEHNPSQTMSAAGVGGGRLKACATTELRGFTDGAGLTSERFGTLVLSNGVVRVDSTRPAVYAAVESIQAGEGSPQPAFSYLWCYPGRTTGSGSGSGGRLQGVRVILDPEGRPAIWQALADTTGTQVLFVSQSLEAAAAARYGKPLAGRHYSVERSMAETPNVVVARVLEDGPVPMGPIVYLRAGNHEVTTVICRCMPAQARRVAEARTYDLLPFAGHESLLAAVREQAKLRTSFWPGERETRLVELLRLP